MKMHWPRKQFSSKASQHDMNLPPENHKINISQHEETYKDELHIGILT